MRMIGWRGRAGIAVAVTVGVAAVAALTTFWVVPGTFAVAGLAAALTWRSRRVANAVTLAAAGVSLAVTIASPRDGAASPSIVLSTLVEIGVLLVLTAGVVRMNPIRRAGLVAVPAVLAVGAWVLRVDAPTSTTVLLGCAAWTGLAGGAVAVGAYLRGVDLRRTRSVADARRVQRLLLARELHDFVAHDISEILAQSQAGQILANREPDRARAALRTIEGAALRALESMDRTIHVLRGEEASPAGPPSPTLAELQDLVDRFARAHPAEVAVDIDPAVPREVTPTAYRIVIEALGNVRRHAPAARQVTVSVRNTGTDISIAVADDGGPPPRAPARSGGLGLPGLVERVRALGGTVEFGPRSPSGWQVAAAVPLRAPSGRVASLGEGMA